MKQRKRHNKLRRDQAPSLIVERLSGNTRNGKNGECHHRQRGSLYPHNSLAQDYRLAHYSEHQQPEHHAIDFIERDIRMSK